MTATTNKAVAVLAGRVIKPCTIYSYLNLRVEDDWSTGRQRLVPYPFKEGPPTQEIIIVDEASMASQRLLEYMIQRTTQCKFLLVGDIFQLPPVGEGSSPMLSMGAKVSLLTQIMRTNKPDLEKVYADAREVVVANSGIYVPAPSENVQHIRMADIRGVLDPDTKIIAYTNACVNSCNLSARDTFNRPMTPVVGDHLLIEDVYHSNGSPLNYVSEEIFVHGIEAKEHPVLSVPCHQITARDGRVFFATQDTGHRKVLMDQAARNKEWPLYFRYKNLLADIRFNHSITGHKSQGSTYGDVMVIMPNMQSCRDKSLLRRLLYVAYTRCTGTLYIVN